MDVVDNLRLARRQPQHRAVGHGDGFGNLQLARGGTLVFVLLYAGMAVANRLTADLPADAFALILVMSD